ncbi:hypothetical protein [Pseudomonas thivervalensis]
MNKYKAVSGVAWVFLLGCIVIWMGGVFALANETTPASAGDVYKLEASR